MANNVPSTDTANYHLACTECPTRVRCLANRLSQRELQQLSQFSHIARKVPKGTVIYRAGEDTPHLYGLRSGAIKTYEIDQQGYQRVNGFPLAGDSFGLADLAASQTSEFAETVTDSVVCCFPLKPLKRLMAESPQLLENLIQQYSSSLRKQQENAKDEDALKRLSDFFKHLQQSYSRPGLRASGFPLPMPNKDIANHLRLRPETLSRLLQQLKASGRLTIKGRTVVRFNAVDDAETYRLAS